MKLRALRLRHVRQFGAEGVAIEAIGDGVNVLAAPNEFGKTTLFDALRVALFFKASSKHRDVTGLVPDPGGGTPEIEVDLDVSEGAFRLAKRFGAGARARIAERPGDRTVATGDAVQDWLVDVLGSERRELGPPGLLWVTQGASLDEPAGAAGTLEGLLEREVGDVVSGEGARRVLERARTERERLVTARTRQPKAGSEYETAVTRRRELDETILASEAKAAASERARGRIGEIDARLAVLDDPEEDARLAAALEEARRALEAARAAAERLTARARELATARESEERAAVAVEALRARHAAAQATLKRRDAADVARNEAETRRERADAAEAAARRERDTTRTTWEAARRERERAQRAAAAEAAAAELDELKARVQRVRDIETERARLAGARGEIRLDERALSALERLRDAWREASAQLAASRPTVAVTYADGGGRVRIAGRVLDDGETLRLAERTVLTLDGIGELAIEPGGSKDVAAAEVAAAGRRAELDRALAAHGVADVVTARAKLREAESLDARLAELARELTRLAPDGVDTLARELPLKESRLADRDAQAPDAGAAEETERRAYAALEAAEQGWRERLDDAQRAREAASAAAAQAHSLQERARELEAELGPRASWAGALEATEARLAAARESRERAAAAHASAAEQSADGAAAEAQLRRLEQAQANRRDERERLLREREGLAGELRAAAAEGLDERLAAEREERSFWAEREAAFEAHVDALDVLIETLSEAERDARERYTAPVLARLRPLIRAVLPAAELTLGGDFAPRALHRGARVDQVERLSGGTREQLAILCRLGFATVMAERGRPMPVVLDDAIVFSDDRRIERMFDALTLAGEAVQVLVLTCRERSFERLGGRRLRSVPWPARSER